MEIRLYQITLIVKNQAEALDFYLNKVGFEKKTDFTPPGGYRWITVGPKGQDIELALLETARAAESHWGIKWQPGIYPPILLRVSDCRGAFTELKNRGVKFMQEKPDERPWGTSVTFTDPDGNLFSLNQVPEHPPSA